MKRFAKLVAVLLPMVMVMTGCPNGNDNGGGDTPDPDWNTGGQWKTVYHVYETEGDGSFHLHVNEGYLEIQKIFLNNTATATGATTVFDFTATPTHTSADDGGNIWWVDWDGGNVEDAGTPNGRLKFAGGDDGDGYVHGGGFGSPKFATFSCIGFVIRTTGGGDTRFEFPKDAIHQFGSLLP